jgi:hypothetical protein
VAHDRPRQRAENSIFEYVWGRCKMCGCGVEELRIFDNETHNLKKVISAKDHPEFAPSLGLGCCLFETHMKHSTS